jgi:hypothetical protein
VLEPGAEASVVGTTPVLSMGNSSRCYDHLDLSCIGLDRL